VPEFADTMCEHQVITCYCFSLSSNSINDKSETSNCFESISSKCQFSVGSDKKRECRSSQLQCANARSSLAIVSASLPTVQTINLRLQTVSNRYHRNANFLLEVTKKKSAGVRSYNVQTPGHHSLLFQLLYQLCER